MNQGNVPMFKFIVLGDQNVGKSSFIKQYSQSIFDEVAVTLFVELYTKTVVVDKGKVKLQIWDTAGEEKYQSNIKLHYHDAAAVFVLYDVNDRNTFKKLHQWGNAIDECAPKEIIKILVGNKSDLERQVPKQEAEQFKSDNNFDLYFETSAKANENVEQAFLEAVNLVIKRVFVNESYRDSIIKSEIPISDAPQIQKPIRLKSIPQPQQADPQQQQKTNNKWCC